jgi:hypothetical protein
MAPLGSVDDDGIAVGIAPNGCHLRPTVGAERAKAGISALGEEIAELIGNGFGHHVLRAGSPQIRPPERGAFARALTASFSIGRAPAISAVHALELSIASRRQSDGRIFIAWSGRHK